MKLAKIESIEENCTVSVSAIGTKCKLSQEDQSTIWNMVLESGNCTNEVEKEQLYSLFTEYSDLLSQQQWTGPHISDEASHQHHLPHHIPQARRDEVND